jgi:hypothetical protein
MTQERVPKYKAIMQWPAKYVRTRIGETLIIFAFLAILWFSVRQGLSAKDIGTVILTGISTVIGALYAFHLTERKEKNEVRVNRIRALNKAIFLIGRQLNAVQSIRNDLAPYSTPDKRLFGCQAAIPPDYSDLRVDFETLSFLLESVNPDLLFRLSVEQDHFYVTMSSISLRAQFYVDHFQPAWFSSGINPGRISQEDARIKIGEIVFDSAVKHTDAMFDALDEAASKLQRILDELRKFSSHLYPTEKFLLFRIKNEESHDAVKRYRM